MGGGGVLGRKWILPMRLPEVAPPLRVPPVQAGEAVLRARFDLGAFVPPGLVERLMAASYSLGSYHAFWRRGALLKAKLREDGKHGAPRDGRLVLEVRGLGEVRGGGRGGAAGSDGGEPSGYALHFEAIGPHGCKASLGSLMARARALTDLLLRDFPGMIASPMTAVTAAPAGIW